MVSSTKRLALRLGHFLALECFQSLLVFPDDNKLEYNQARLQLKETNCLFALAVSLIGSMLVQHSLCIFPLDLRIPGPVLQSTRLGIRLQRGISRRSGEKTFSGQIRNGRRRSGCGRGGTLSA